MLKQKYHMYITMS